MYWFSRLIRITDLSLCLHFLYIFLFENYLNEIFSFIVLKEKSADEKSAIEIYTDMYRLLGQREGDVKPVALHKKAILLTMQNQSMVLYYTQRFN